MFLICCFIVWAAAWVAILENSSSSGVISINKSSHSSISEFSFFASDKYICLSSSSISPSLGTTWKTL